MKMNPKKEKKKFNIGDSVGWISKDQKTNKIKIFFGEVVAVVPPEKDFREIEEELRSKFVFFAYWSGGTWRTEESYAVLTVTPGHLPRLYWPRVRALEKIKDKIDKKKN
jgi:hypothetical protein